MNSNFKYSDTNKRYHTYSFYLKQKYLQKVFRIPIDAGFTCPNRDGTCGYGGCSFCSMAGSGDAIIGSNIEEQIETGFTTMRKKWPDGLAIAYFQAFTNTHASLDTLRKLYTPFVYDDRFIEIIIATRSDCLDQEKIDFFQELAKIKPIWIELGLQSIHQKTADYIRRGHDLANFKSIIDKLSETDLKIGVHIINGLPHETKEMMLQTAKYVAQLPIHGIKIHMFHVLKKTLEAVRYQSNPYPLLTRDEYVDITSQQLLYLPAHMIILRITGDGIGSDLIAPLWTIKKVQVTNEIDKKLARENNYQGKLYQKHQSADPSVVG